MRIGIIVGSIREGRAGSSVGAWVLDRATKRDGVEYDLLELADFDVPLLTDPTVPGAANRQYANEKVRAWGAKIDEYDGFVFVTPEYNHGVPGAFKNAVDSIYPEWNHKAIGLIGYGADGGVRAIEQWRAVLANTLSIVVRHQLSLLMFHDFADGEFRPIDRRDQELSALLDQVEEMTKTVTVLR